MPSSFVSVVLTAALVLLALGQAGAGQAERPAPDRAVVYKTVGDVKLRLHIYEPKGHAATDRRPAIVFFFGGGWRGGSTRQFAPHARYFASRGMLAITAEYRVASRHKVKPFACLADAKSAMRYVRANAERLGIHPVRIVGAGGSAGGHLAAATALVDGFDAEGDDLSVSPRPNALVLFNPVIDTTKRGYGASRLGAEPEDFSPVHHVGPDAPPTIIFHGTADTTVPFENVERFRETMRAAGNRCELVPFKGEKHAFFNYGRKGNRPYVATVRAADAFLASLGYLTGEPTVGEDGR
jgi:acetyl esterase/lipase